MVKVRFIKKEIKTLEDKLDNGIVRNGQVIAPKYAWCIQRKLWRFGRWHHWMWKKTYPHHLEFLKI